MKLSFIAFKAREGVLILKVTLGGSIDKVVKEETVMALGTHPFCCAVRIATG